MRLPAALFAAAIIAAVSTQASAGTPKLSGTYSYLDNKICQGSLGWATDSGTGDTADFSVVSNGTIRSTLGTLKFNSSTGQVTGTGTEAYGSLVLGNTSEDVTSETVTLSGPFSVTSSSLTLGGKTYSAAYGGIANDVAARVRFLGSNATCIETGTLDRN